MTLYKPIHPLKVSSEIVAQIRDLIYSGLLKPGEQLPVERELANKFNVSRATLREALNILDAMGLIDIIRRKGIFVKPLASSEIQGPLSTFLNSSAHRAYELFEVRKSLDAQIVYIAAKRATPQNIKELAQCLEAMKRNTESGDIDRWYKADNEFHLAMARATQNDVFVHLLYTLIEMDSNHLQDVRKEIYKSTAHQELVYGNHKRMYEAVVSGDGEAAKRIAIEIFSWTMEEIKANPFV